MTDAGIKTRILYNMLKDVNKILNYRKTIFWLDCGTLLGAIRDQSLIPWDMDIDLGCWKSNDDYEVKQSLKNEFIKLGYTVFLHDHYLNIHFKDYPKLNCDLNFYTIHGDLAITPSSSLTPFLNDKISKLANHTIKSIYNKKMYVKRYPNFVKVVMKLYFFLINKIFLFFPSNLKSRFLNLLIVIRKNASKHKAEVVPKFYFENFKKKSVFDGNYLIPEESEEYLKFRYGEDWKTPIQEWDTISQDGTVKDIL
jgi:phosphorylcholine metabolism protein LicD